MYTRLDNCENDIELDAFKVEMLDRFGAIPTSVQDLFTTVQCRKLGVQFGFEKMTLKDNTLRCYFINRPDSPYFESGMFKNILAFLQIGTNKAKLKQAGKLFLLIVEDVKSMVAMHAFLQRMHKAVVPVAQSVAV